MTIRSGRQEQIPFLTEVTVEGINDVIGVINRLFDGILGRGTQQNVPQFVRTKVVSTLPTTGTIDEGEFVLYQSGATKRLYTKVNGSLRYMNLT